MCGSVPGGINPTTRIRSPPICRARSAIIVVVHTTIGRPDCVAGSGVSGARPQPQINPALSAHTLTISRIRRISRFDPHRTFTFYSFPESQTPIFSSPGFHRPKMYKTKHDVANGTQSRRLVNSGLRKFSTVCSRNIRWSVSKTVNKHIIGLFVAHTLRQTIRPISMNVPASISFGLLTDTVKTHEGHCRARERHAIRGSATKSGESTAPTQGC
jgi:hypothetical protein